MRHQKKGRKLGTDASHTRAILKGVAIGLFKSERIKTTEARAKEVRPLVDKVITWAKKGDVHSRRLAIAALGDKELVAKVFNDRERFEGRPGGYTRILKLGPRKGDAGPMVIMELVD
jgi:large subunit ribosomal protein L17